MTGYHTHPDTETPHQTPQKCVPKTITTDTPREARIIAAPEAKTTSIRLDIGTEMNKETFVCDIEIFMNHYLPKVDEMLLHAVLDELKSRGIMVPSGIPGTDVSTAPVATSPDATNLQPEPYSHVFKAFKPPCVMTKKPKGRVLEKVVFRPLSQIGHAICSALKKAGVKTNGYVIRMCGDNHLKSTINGSNHKIDACMTKNKNKNKQIRITDIAVAFEFKLTRASKMENRIQIASQANHAINDDARRIFVFGITIEDDRVSLWIFSRSHSVKSVSFSMVERADLYVKIMISLFCATDYQLGFDPLVQLTRDNHFIYEFPPSDGSGKAKHYRTKHSIFASRSVGLAGRFTRIWQVELVDPTNHYLQVAGAEDMILKDVSLEIDAPTEADIQERVFSDIKGLRSDSEKPLYDRPIMRDLAEDERDFLTDLVEGEKFKNFFSCIVAKSVGPATPSVAPQVWADTGLFPVSEKDLLEVTPYQTIRPPQGTKVANSDASYTLPPDVQHYTSFPPRRPCRMVFERVYTPLSNIPALGEAFDILKQTFYVLLLMFCAGWVHRDISAGNILASWDASKQKWQVKLSDLEYAKRFPSDTDSASHILKTGTPYFLPVEIQLSSLILPPVLNPRDNITAADFARQLDRPVKHGYQHDLESLWWMFLWLGSQRVKHILRRPLAATVFKHSPNTGEYRSQLFQANLITNKNVTMSLPESLRTDFLSALDCLRGELLTEYMTRNLEGKQEDPGAYSHVISAPFQAFFETFESFQDEWSAIELRVDQEMGRKGVEEQGAEGENVSGSSGKRKATEDMEGTETADGVSEVSVRKDAEAGTVTSGPSGYGMKKATFTLDHEQGNTSDETPVLEKEAISRGKKASALLQRATGPTTRSMTQAGQAKSVPKKKATFTPEAEQERTSDEAPALGNNRNPSAALQRASGPRTRSMSQAGGAGKAKSTKPQEKMKKSDRDGPKPSKRARR